MLPSGSNSDSKSGSNNTACFLFSSDFVASWVKPPPDIMSRVCPSRSATAASLLPASLVVTSFPQPMFMNLRVTEGISGHRKVGMRSALPPPGSVCEAGTSKFEKHICKSETTLREIRNVSDFAARNNFREHVYHSAKSETFPNRRGCGCSANSETIFADRWNFHVSPGFANYRSASEPPRVAARNNFREQS